MKARKFVVTLAAGVAAAGLTAGAFSTANASTSATASSATFAPATVNRTVKPFAVSNGISSSYGNISFTNRAVTVSGKVNSGSGVDGAMVSFVARNASGKIVGKGSRTVAKGQVRGFTFQVASNVKGGVQSVLVKVFSVDKNGNIGRNGSRPSQIVSR